MISMLYLIGMGLNDEEDLSVKAINILSRCNSVFYESYTSKWHGNLKRLEKLCSKKITVLNREKVESIFLINEAKEKKSLVPLGTALFCKPWPKRL